MNANANGLARALALATASALPVLDAPDSGIGANRAWTGCVP